MHQTKQKYALIGPDIAAGAGVSSGFKLFTSLSLGAFLMVVVGYGALFAYTNIAWKHEIGRVDDEMDALNETLRDEIMEGDALLYGNITSGDALLYGNITALNATLCSKIMEGDTRLAELILNISIDDTNQTIISLVNALNETLCTKIMEGDTSLESDITSVNNTLTARIDEALVSINGVTGAPGPSSNLLLVSGNEPGIEITSNAMLHSIEVKNTGVVTLNGVPSFSGSSDMLVTGVGMITVNAFPLASTITINGTELSHALSNLQMQTNMQEMHIMQLESNVTSLQNQVNTIQMVGDMIAQDLNGTAVTFNMTLMQLVMDVMTLQSTVVALQSQIDALNVNASAIPPGTITPFGGTVIPTGYLLCDGSEYLMSAYPALYAVIGMMYCPGPCVGPMSFAVPDLRGKVPAGQGGTALSGTIGSSVGAETHTLTIPQIPAHFHTGFTGTESNDHSHSGTTGLQSNNHNHNIPLGNNDASNFGTGLYPAINANAGNPLPVGERTVLTLGINSDHNHAFTTGGRSAGHSHSFSTSNIGAGVAHNNIQPSLIVKYIIKT
jgi:microcystin-dependent protein